jgi:hypothetical protein
LEFIRYEITEGNVAKLKDARLLFSRDEVPENSAYIVSKDKEQKTISR